MVIKELQVLSEALWESIKTNLLFFSSIQIFAKRLSEFDFTNLKKNDIKELLIYANKIEAFFKDYRSSGTDLYVPPHETSSNDETVKSILVLTIKLSNMSDDELANEVSSVKPIAKAKSIGDGTIFIGHGRSKLWARIQLFLLDDLKLKTISFESESHTSESITSVLEEFLDRASYAILVLTAEDETHDRKIRARQNVIHEAGLFQGRLGFKKVIILKQNEVEEFTNIAGLQYISFKDDNIEQTFYELQRTLKKAGLLHI